MEFDPFAPSKPEKDKKKEEERKKRVRFGLPVAKVETDESADKAESKPEESRSRSVTEEIVAAIDEKKQADESKKSTEEQASSDVETDTEQSVESTLEPENTEQSAYHDLPPHNLESNELLGGEVIVELNGDEPIAERVIPLRGEVAAEPPRSEISPQASSGHPERQHRAQSEELAPEANPAGGGEVPPTLPPENLASAPEQPEPTPEPIQSEEFASGAAHRQRAEAGTDGPGFANASPVTQKAGEQPATKEDVEDALYRTAKARQQRGVLSGLLMGSWLAGRRRLRRHEKRETRALNKQQDNLERAKQEFRTAAVSQENHRASTERRVSNLEKRFENPSRGEKLDSMNTPERSSSRVEPAEKLDIPENHRLENSAWHSIEVDSKTGKPVENPTFQYGHEYYRERAQEATPVNQRNAAAGEVALTAAALSQSSPRFGATNGPAPGVPDIPLATTQGAPSAIRPPSTDTSAAKQATATGPLWPWLLALFAVLVCLVALLR